MRANIDFCPLPLVTEPLPVLMAVRKR